jgi:D-lactate dehydrogenase (cytochrome)
VILTIQSGIPVARIELLDEVQMAACNKFSDLDYPDQPTLFLEFHGSEASVKEQAEAVGALCEEFGGSNFQWTTKAEDRNKLWEARHNAAYAAKALKTNASIWATDVCVPISRLAECILETKKDIVANELTAPIVGHVGDGNFHLAFVFAEGDNEGMKKAEEVNDRMVMRALSMGGTCTGEHGVGTGKMKFLLAEHGEAVSVMREIKKALDPQNIFNPGKIFSV